MLEQGLTDRLAIAPLLGPGQGAEQGPGADRLQAQVTQDTGDLGLRGRLDQTRQNHLLKGPITPNRLTQPQTLVGAVQDHNNLECLDSTVVVARPVRPGAGSRDSRSSSPWPCQAAIFCRPASSKTSSSVSSWAEPRCSTIRRTPPDLDTI